MLSCYNKMEGREGQREWGGGREGGRDGRKEKRERGSLIVGLLYKITSP